MAFYGKKFKKTKFENVDELFDKLDAPEHFRKMMKNTEVLTSFAKNADGSVQSTVAKLDGEQVFTFKMAPDVETEFTTPNDIKAKMFCQIKDDRIDTVITFPDGSKIHMDRLFEGNTLKFVIYKEGLDLKATVTQEAV